MATFKYSSSNEIQPRATLNRVHFVLYSSAILALLHYHTVVLSSFLLLLANLLLCFMWLLSQGLRWRPIRRREFPDLLPQVTGEPFPALDVFVCTADPHKEPPASVACTALSVLAFDYPTDRLSVYLSDDGASDLTLFAFIEAAKFARHWLPFCRHKGLIERSPEAYFHSFNAGEEAEEMKVMFESLREKVNCAVEKGYVDLNLVNSPEEKEMFKKWKNFTRRDHPSVIQVLLESSRDRDSTGHPLPNLIYVSRQKHPDSSHHFKAGALNALVRVSEAMTNAPIILTLDCDSQSNDPNTPNRALCYLLDPNLSPNLAFVQFPQKFRGINTSDIYAGELRRIFIIGSRGLDGLHGPNYVGTCCFFQRRSLYGPPPAVLPPSNESKLCILQSDSVLQKAHHASSCNYDHAQDWGSQIGFRYGSLVEDYNTGYRLHCQGWRSVFCNPDRPAFLGDAPKSLYDVLSQSRRWTVGLYEVAFSRYSPIFYGTRKASLLTGLSYMHYALWGSWCIPLIIYAFLPQLALFYSKPLFPKASEPWFYLYVYLFLASYAQDLIEFMEVGGLIRRWWSDQRMWLIRGVTSSSMGALEFILSQIGVSDPGFNLTSKTKMEEEEKLYDNGMFSFRAASPFFFSLGTIAIVNLISFTVGFMKAVRRAGGLDEMLLQLLLSGFIMTNSWPVYEAMFFRNDGGKMPRSVTIASILLAFIFFCFGYLFL